MKSFARLKGFLILIVAIFLLSGCLSDLQKPTGLEANEDNEFAHHDKEENNINEPEENNEQNETNEIDDNDNSSEDADNNNDNENLITDSKDEQSTSTSDKQDEQKTKPKEEPKRDNSKTTNNPKNKDKDKDKQKPKPPKKNDKPKENKPPPPPPKEEEEEKDPKSTITHSIVIAAEGSHGQRVCQEKKYEGCPEDGRAEVPLPPTVMEIEDEDTVLEALIGITMERKIHMDYRGGRGATAYIQGMGDVYEFDRGQGSGWMFRINGIFPDRGAGVVPLCDGDTVEWLYTTNLGQDLKADLKPFRRDGKCP